MKTHDGCVRGFHWLSRAYYAKACRSEDVIDELMVGMYALEGGTTGEFAIRWTMLGGKPSPRLEAFDDSWHALTQFDDLLAWLAEVDGESPPPERVADALRQFGVRDMTQRTNPRTSPAEREYASWFAREAT